LLDNGLYLSRKIKFGRRYLAAPNTSELQKNMRDEEVSYYQDRHMRDNSLRQCYYDIINQSGQPGVPKSMVNILTEMENL
jgi:hypothetical protein